MKINRLRLLGFKSFVEPTELLIEPGLTGVLGPNGCGKSNLLEALRWVMGETSYKSMRGAAMEDVIFSGTDKRPARNFAEVTIFIDNTARKAPAEFNDSDTIEITRRIERDLGSAYRINGREARARDVKILFEDAATGARSPALVRQGQIGEIVNAKPEKRRRILEDAAGIAGLHSRRHEADLRLKQASNNLARLEDVAGQLNSQIESLKRQARQARRYKQISGEIRQSEAILLHLGWLDMQAHVAGEESALGEAVRKLAAATQTESAALRIEADRAEALQPLRDDEAVKAATLHRLKIEQENFEKEARRAKERTFELTARADQLERDIAREKGLIEEARDALAGFEKEKDALTEENRLGTDFAEQAVSELGAAETTVAGAETRLKNAGAKLADDRAQRKSLETARTERADGLSRLESQLADLDANARRIAAAAPDIAKVTNAQQTGRRLAQEIGDIETKALDAESQARSAAHAATVAREASTSANLTAGRLGTELETLHKLLKPQHDDAYPPIVDHLEVTAGYEMALGAAIGDGLDAPMSEDAPLHWRALDFGADPALKADVHVLSDYVQGAAELTRRLRQIGIVAREDGASLQPKLLPGQCLVTLEGDLWRWDGFVAAAHAPSAAAKRLAERNRLGGLEREEGEARLEAERLAKADAQAAGFHSAAQESERGLRLTWRETQGKLAAAREALSVAETAARETESKLESIAEAKARLDDSHREAREKLKSTDTAIAALPAPGGLEAELAGAQGDAEGCRAALADAKATQAALARERQMRDRRLAAVGDEHARWLARSSGANAQIKTLDERQREAAAELESLAELPQQIDTRRQALMSELGKAEEGRLGAADKLAAAETAHRDGVQALRGAQAALATEREQRARIEVRLEGARERRSEQVRKIRDALDCAPDGCLEVAKIDVETELAPLADVERQLGRLKSDRDRLGGVNLAADDELERLGEEFKAMNDERLDLEQAIAKLRGAIGDLNKEGRKRLMAAFQSVDAHFRRLFGTLFNGGEARLEMIEGEDPLEGGLEIIARPPGKKPVTLSLLSGGEQSLTAMSLIFAVFLTNPSPICVLDEVDAPLDDSNVERFCNMMDNMEAETDTRFLVITHHPMTMARMNRLFGVTMGEKGVSQLVSVDLATAERIVDAA